MSWLNIGSALVATLRADAGVQSYTTTSGTVVPIYNKQASQKAAPPYIVYTDVSEIDTRSSPRDEVDALYQVEAWDKRNPINRDPVTMELFDAIHSALDGKALTITGWTVYLCVFVGKQEFLENVSGEQYERYIGEYRIRASKD